MTESILDELWAKIKNENYLILRNYETILRDICNGGDIDILCESKKRIVDLLYAKPAREDILIYNYQLYIGKQRIAIDIREIGDEYYDSNWEKEMLKKRVSYKNFYILESEEYIYSLLYHSLIHKKKIADKYREIFRQYFYTDDEIQLLEKLKKYMHKKGYKPVFPLDKGVNFNRNNFMILKN